MSGKRHKIYISKTKRVFVAIRIDDDFRNYLNNIQLKIINHKDNNLKIKMVERNNLHISIKFFGDLNQLEIEKIEHALQEISSGLKPFRITLLKEIGAFPDFRKPRVLWIGLKNGETELIEIYNHIKSRLSQETFYPSEKKYTAHITLGRIKYIKYTSNLIQSLSDISFGDISQKVNSIELIESTLNSDGPVYNTINKFLFLK